jgi:predicted nucleic acid-binding protein
VSGVWGSGALVVDTSAWSRPHRPEVRDAWVEALLGDRMRLSPAVRLEILLSARDGEGFDATQSGLDAVRIAPLNPSVLRTAEAAMRALAHRFAGTHRIPIVDYLVAAAAQEINATVLHYDADYELLAEVMDFESAWLGPRGSLP